VAAARIFTREEAERTLPLVRRVVADAREEHRRWRLAVARYELLAAGLRADEGEPPAVVEARQAVATHARRITDCIAELEAIGCVLKSFEEGLVDFCSMRGDRLVYLCWRLGEAGITHWHELESGFAGRQPIDDAILTAVDG